MVREGSLEAPQRQPLGWRDEGFYDEDSLFQELERIYDICHGCRRCVSLCDAFPTLFDLVDESPTLEVDGIPKEDYTKVVDQCFLCDLCAETKCPYLPPHEWAVGLSPPDAARQGLALQAGRHQVAGPGLITSTDRVFNALSKPGIAGTANAAAGIGPLRRLGERIAGIAADAPLPVFNAKPLSKRVGASAGDEFDAVPFGPHHRACGHLRDLLRRLQHARNRRGTRSPCSNHNRIPVTILKDAGCCGMPKLELGDLDRVAAMKDANLPAFLEAIESGCDLLAPVPSCVLMYKQETAPDVPRRRGCLPGCGRVLRPVRIPHAAPQGRATEHGFQQSHWARSPTTWPATSACRTIGGKTREFLNLIDGTEVTPIERCSGHDGTYAVKAETHAKAMKIARPVVNRVKQANPDRFGSDCPMAGRLIAHGLEAQGEPAEAEHPITMVRAAYGI